MMLRNFGKALPIGLMQQDSLMMFDDYRPMHTTSEAN